MQQSPWYGESLENWYSYFSFGTGAFFPLNSHYMVYFIIWEIHGFPSKTPQYGKMQQNPWNGESLGNKYSYFFHSMGAFFSFRLSSYGIRHHMGNAWFFPLISYSTGKCNKTDRMGRTWEIGTHTFPIGWVLSSHYIPILWYTSSYGKCICFLINFSWNGKRQSNPSAGESRRKLVPGNFL